MVFWCFVSLFRCFAVSVFSNVHNKTLEIKDYTIDKDVDLFAITESWLKADESSGFCFSGHRTKWIWLFTLSKANWNWRRPSCFV